MGRIATAVLVVVGCLWAPLVARVGSVFQYIQMFWGFISPAIVAVFVFGLYAPRTPAPAASGAMLLGIPIYGSLLWALPDVAFLHHMGITFLLVSMWLVVYTRFRPRSVPFVLDAETELELEPARYGKWFGGAVIVGAGVLYAMFF